MEPIVIPEDLSGLDSDALTILATQAEERARELAQSGDLTDETAAEVEALVDGVVRIGSVLTERDADRVAASDRAAAALARIAPVVAPAEPEVTPEAVADPAIVVVEETPVAAAEVVPAPVAVAPAAPAAAELVPVAASAAPARQPSVAALRARQAASAVRPSEDTPAPAGQVGYFAATRHAPGFSASDRLGRMELAEAMTQFSHRMGVVPDGVIEQVRMATAGIDYGENTLSLDPSANFGIIQRAIDERNARREAQSQAQAQGLVASLGVQIPLCPTFDIFSVASPQSPMENNLPVVGAPQGGIRFLLPANLNAGAGGIGVTTEAQDRAGYVSGAPSGPTAEKPFVTFGAPTTSEVFVTAISRGVRFGNLQVRTFPQWIADRLDDMAILFARVKETLYLDRIAAGSTAVTFTTPYGASRGIIHAYIQARAGYVKRNSMAYDARVDLYLPDWTRDMMLVDLFNDHAQGADQLERAANRARLDTLFSNLGFNVTWYYDTATGAAQAFNTAQAAGALNAFPATVRGYMHAPGTFLRLDGGTLDVGMYRDSRLNRTNDVEMFSEQWLEVAKVGLESIQLTVTTTPNGAAPEPAALMGAV